MTRQQFWDNQSIRWATGVAPALLLLLLCSPALAQDSDSSTEVEMEADDGAVPPEQPAADDDGSEATGGDTEAAAPTGPRVGRTPARHGQSGIIHVLTADAIEVHTFGLSLQGEFFSAGNVARDGDTNTRLLGRFGLAYAPHALVEVFFSLAGQGNVNDLVDPSLIQTQGDFRLGAKAFYSLDDSGFGIGGAFGIVFLNGPDGVGVEFSATSLDLRGLFSYDFSRFDDVPLLLHLNLGFFLDNSSALFDVPLQRVERFAHQVSEYNQFEIGFGAEVPVDYVTPFLEWNLGIPLGDNDTVDCVVTPIPCVSDAGFPAFPNALTLGAKVTPYERLVLQLAVDIGLTSEEAEGLPSTPPYNVMFGLAYNIDPNASATPPIIEPTVGWVLGEVVDELSGEPIAQAVIRYPGTTFTAQSTDPTSGRFRSYELAIASEIIIEVSHPNYETRTFSRVIIDGEDGIRIRLTPTSNNAMISGSVTDANGTALPATIYMEGSEVSGQVEVDPLTAEFAFELEPGPYVITVVADGFESDRREVELERGPVAWELMLDSLGPDQIAVLRGDRIDLSGERVTFDDNDDELTPVSEEILVQVADLLNQYSDIELRVVAHSDDTGDLELTQEQAEIVVAFLEAHGIEASRLFAEGEGGERPLFPNISERNRQRNWRVEFLFVE